MVDITKDEFWDSKFEEKSKTESKAKQFIIKHKIITALLISLGILVAINTILIYNFVIMLGAIR